MHTFLFAFKTKYHNLKLISKVSKQLNVHRGTKAQTHWLFSSACRLLTPAAAVCALRVSPQSRSVGCDVWLWASTLHVAAKQHSQGVHPGVSVLVCALSAPIRLYWWFFNWSRFWKNKLTRRPRYFLTYQNTVILCIIHKNCFPQSLPWPCSVPQ